MLTRTTDSAQTNTKALAQLIAWSGEQNYAETILDREDGESKLAELGSAALEGYEIDKLSRSDWETEAKLAMEAVQQKTETKNHPWPNAANIKYPLLTTATLQFGARTLPVLVQGDRVVKVKTVGRDPFGLKRARAERVSLHMSYQILKKMEGWEESTDILVHQLPVLGDGFKKVYNDDEEGKPCSDMVSAMNVVVNQKTKSLRSVPRISHEIELYPHEIEERIRGGTFIEFDYKTQGGSESAATAGTDRANSPNDPDGPQLFIEQHRYIDMDEDGLQEPWIVTFHKDSGKVVRVVANYDLRKAKFGKNGKLVKLPRYQFFVHFPFLPDPNGGFYGIGYGRLLRSIGETINSTLNQLIDAGTLQNRGGGFIGSGVDLKKASITVRMNEWKVLNVPGQDIRKAFVPHNFAGPSPVLFQLLGLMIDMGKQISNVQDIMTGEARAQTMQPTTLLALVEQGMKVYTSILKRLFRSMGEEFQLLYRINQRYPDEEGYQDIIDWQEPMDALQQAAQMEAEGQPIPEELERLLTQPTMKEDYREDDCDITPVADPNAATDMQKMAKAQIVMEVAEHPTLGPTVNAQEATKRVFDAAQIEDPESLIIQPQGPDPMQVADLQATTEKKRAESVKALATADKMDREAEKTDQETKVTRAEIISGSTDADKAVERAAKQEQIRRSQHDSEISQQQADKPDPKPAGAKEAA